MTLTAISLLQIPVSPPRFNRHLPANHRVPHLGLFWRQFRFLEYISTSENSQLVCNNKHRQLQTLLFGYLSGQADDLLL
jgi:hypothetical protein